MVSENSPFSFRPDSLLPRVNDRTLVRVLGAEVCGQLELEDGRGVVQPGRDGVQDQLLVPVEEGLALELADQPLHAVARVLEGGALQMAQDLVS